MDMLVMGDVVITRRTARDRPIVTEFDVDLRQNVTNGGNVDLSQEGGLN
jgi:hypothetical protein